MTLNQTTAHTTNRSRLAGRALVSLTVFAVASVLLGAVAYGHEGSAEIKLKNLEPGAQSLRYRLDVEVTFAADGHAVEDATVTVAGDSDSGASLSPVVLEPAGEGIFAGDLQLPESGTWSLRVTSVNPPGVLDMEPIAAGGDVGIVEEPVESETDEPVLLEEPGALDGFEDIEDPSSDSDDSNNAVLIGAVIAVLAVAGVGGFVWARKQGASNEPDSGNSEP